MLYVVYILQLYRDARVYQRAMKLLDQSDEKINENTPKSTIASTLQSLGMNSNPVLIDRIRRARQKEEEEETAEAAILYGRFTVHLTAMTAAAVIIISTLIAGIFVFFGWSKSPEKTARELEVPVFFHRRHLSRRCIFGSRYVPVDRCGQAR